MNQNFIQLYCIKPCPSRQRSALSIALLVVIVLVITEMNSKSCTMGALHQRKEVLSWPSSLMEFTFELVYLSLEFKDNPIHHVVGKPGITNVGLRNYVRRHSDMSIPMNQRIGC